MLLQRLVLMGKNNNDNRLLGWDDPLPDAPLSHSSAGDTHYNAYRRFQYPVATTQPVLAK